MGVSGLYIRARRCIRGTLPLRGQSVRGFVDLRITRSIDDFLF
jgi:hypothetical protein